MLTSVCANQTTNIMLSKGSQIFWINFL